MGNATPVLTPLGRQVMQAICEGRVRYQVQDQTVVWYRRGEMGLVERADVSAQFVQLGQTGWAYIEPYDIDVFPPPVEVPVHATPVGEDVLMEAAAAARKRKAKQ